MRNALVALALAALVGCTTTGLQERVPAYSGSSQKTPQNLARCLAPKWQEINSSTSSVETQSGYKIAVSSLFAGTIALATIDGSASGSTVKVFLPSDWAGTQGWKDAAKNCT
jgi:hypothetical protein